MRTPPQAGESGTAPQATGGAEVLTVGTAAMNLVRTVTLAHSTREDAENRAARTIAQDIKTRLAAYLSGTA